MRIAVPYNNGEIFQHFGHTEFFKLYEVENNAVTSAVVMATEGAGHGALSALLKHLEVDVLICGGIGGGAQRALAEVGIKFYAGVSGYANDAVNALIEGTLVYNPNPVCSHHDEHHGDCGGHDHDHHCGSHGCGGHTCGGHK